MKLTKHTRAEIPTGEFALAGRRYPIEDRSHARNALARVSQHGTASEKATVRAKVHAKYPGMGKGDHLKQAHAHLSRAHRQHTPEAMREHVAIAMEHLKSAGAHQSGESHSYDFRRKVNR